MEDKMNTIKDDGCHSLAIERMRFISLDCTENNVAEQIVWAIAFKIEG